jgi:hypothetical protein
MKRILMLSLFIMLTLVWAAAQQPGAMPQGSGAQANPPGAQVPDASQSQVPAPGTAGSPAAQGGAPAGPQDQAANGSVTEGCLGGSNPNYTITDKAGKTYKLNIPPGADASTLASHVGEPVAVMGAVNGAGSSTSINVNKIGRGTSKCPGSGSTSAPPPPKQ